MQFMKAGFTLLMYLILGLPRLIFMLPTLPWINRKAVRWFWIHFDRGVCCLVHGTEERTISGHVGAMARKGRKTFLIIEKVIDTLARLFGDEKEHCRRADDWEIKIKADK